MPKKKPYYPNNIKAIRETPDEFFEARDANGELIPLTFETLMEAKLYGWEFPESIACVIRETNHRGKVKEHIYSSRKWANKKIKQLLIKGHEFTIAADDMIEHVPSQYLE
tara:strand:+ start:84 stop:413 length:330 start_codon:yes stop_codon:yes gene_type:complete